MVTIHSRNRIPTWLRRSLAENSTGNTRRILSTYPLHTVCESALCPNRNECYAHGTATFMILGNTCTRRCSFCAIETGKPETVSEQEPEQVAAAVRDMGLKYAVITSVARDDLADQGAGQFVRTVQAIRRLVPEVQVEVLVPDFHARRDLIAEILDARPDVYNHNLETVERLQRAVRPQAAYARSLEVMRIVKELRSSQTTKSGMMLGLGETDEEVYRAARDLRSAGCDILTLGQYLQPSGDQQSVTRFITPEFFQKLADDVRQFGFREVFAGPYVRSSYHAGETFLKMK